jgi:DNA-directed RNA polymerase specialized sigma24 family protein
VTAVTTARDSGVLTTAALNGDAAVLTALVEEHYGAMHRLARLVGSDATTARNAVRAAWLTALQSPADQIPAASLHGWLLRLVLVELAAPRPPEKVAPAAAASELEPEGSRWAGWWRDRLPPTPEPEHEALEAAIGSLPPGLAALLVLRDVEGLEEGEVAALLGHSPDHQLDFLHQARSGVRNALRASAEAAL